MGFVSWLDVSWQLCRGSLLVQQNHELINSCTSISKRIPHPHLIVHAEYTSLIYCRLIVWWKRKARAQAGNNLQSYFSTIRRCTVACNNDGSHFSNPAWSWLCVIYINAFQVRLLARCRVSTRSGAGWHPPYAWIDLPLAESDNAGQV